MIRITLASTESSLLRKAVTQIKTKHGLKILKRVTDDGSPQFNTCIVYEESDEAYEHYDAMYCWEGPKPKPRVSKASMSVSEYMAETYPPSVSFAPSILFEELKRYKEKEEAYLFGVEYNAKGTLVKKDAAFKIKAPKKGR